MAKNKKFEVMPIEESKVFRINTGTITPDMAESFLAKMKLELSKNLLAESPKNLYTRTLITERMKKYKIYEPLTMIADYFIPTR